MQRYFIDQPIEPQIGVQFEITGAIFHHWVRVMRAEPTATAEFVTKAELVLVGRLISLSDETGIVEIVQIKKPQVELPLRVTIACGLSKGDKPEQIVQRGTELGASEFVFFDSQYAVAKWAPNKRLRKLQRLAKIAQGAAEQSHRTMIPRVRYVNSLTSLVNESFDAGIVAWEESAKQNEHAQLPTTLSQLSANDHLLAVFGPEGGLSTAEVDLLKQHQILPAGLGPRIMRAETAPQYLLAAISFSKELL